MDLGWCPPQRDLRRAGQPDGTFRFGRERCSAHFLIHVPERGQFSLFLHGPHVWNDRHGRCSPPNAHTHAGDTDSNSSVKSISDTDHTYPHANSNTAPHTDANANANADHTYSYTSNNADADLHFAGVTDADTCDDTNTHSASPNADPHTHSHSDIHANPVGCPCHSGQHLDTFAGGNR
jgi:hypothetical protein